MAELLFKWIVCSSVMATILISLVLIVKTAVRRTFSARWHSILWILLVVKLLVPFGPQSYASIFNLLDLTDTKITQGSYDVINNISTTAQTIAVNTPIPYIKDTLKPAEMPVSKKNAYYSGICIFLWALGLLTVAFFILRGMVRFHIRINEEKEISDLEILHLLEQCKTRLNVRTGLTLVQTSLVSSPALYGFIKPKLLLPEDMLIAPNMQHLKYILLHELAHVKRKDILLTMMIGILSMIHWFNPLIWYGFYHMRQDTELACDELVLKNLEKNEQKDYGRTILQLTEKLSSSYVHPAAAYFTGNKNQLKKRILNIALFKRRSFKVTLLSVFFLLIISFIVLTNAIGSIPSDLPMTEFYGLQP